MSPREAATTIGQSTPITVALAISLCAGAFYSGVLANRVTTLEQSRREDNLGWREIAKELRDISAGTQRRVDILEAKYGKP